MVDWRFSDQDLGFRTELDPKTGRYNVTRLVNRRRTPEGEYRFSIEKGLVEYMSATREGSRGVLFILDGRELFYPLSIADIDRRERLSYFQQAEALYNLARSLEMARSAPLRVEEH